MKKINIKLLTSTAKLPYRGSAEAAGYDLYADSMEEKRDLYIYHTGIAVRLPVGCCGFIFPRSSVVNTGLILGNSVGLLDSDFTGEIKCVFYKREGATAYRIGERIAQLVIAEIPSVEFCRVLELDTTERGANGFGSTGV